MPSCNWYHLEFDEERRILHVAYRIRIHPVTKEHLDLVFATFRKMLDNYKDGGRIYLIIDMTNLIIEPELKSFYAEHARKICEEYLEPQGVARYGYQITRITVRASYNQYRGESPNIFNSREEAYEYIDLLIEKKKLSRLPRPVSMAGENCENC